MPWWRSHSDHARYVDMWMFPGLHPTNIDLLQRLKSADDRQFGTNMDVVGTVSEYSAEQRGWTESHQIGIRSDLWTPDADERARTLERIRSVRREQLKSELKISGRLTVAQKAALDSQIQADVTTQFTTADVHQRRLVLKHFRSTGKRIRWVGTLEELTTWEVANSLAAGRPLLSLSVNLEGNDVFTAVQQHTRRLRYPAVYGFCYLDETTGRVWNLTIKRRWISWGADFDVLADHQLIGMIDGQLIGFGYAAYIDIREPTLAAETQLMDVLTLFASSVGYHTAIRKSIRHRLQATQDGKHQAHVIDPDELRLLTAPRRRVA